MFNKPGEPWLTVIWECTECGKTMNEAYPEGHVSMYTDRDRPVIAHCSRCGDEWRHVSVGAPMDEGSLAVFDEEPV